MISKSILDPNINLSSIIYVSGYVTLQQVPKHQVKVKKSNTKQGSLEVLKKQNISSNGHSAVLPTNQFLF